MTRGYKVVPPTVTTVILGPRVCSWEDQLGDFVSTYISSILYIYIYICIYICIYTYTYTYIYSPLISIIFNPILVGYSQLHMFFPAVMAQVAWWHYWVRMHQAASSQQQILEDKKYGFHFWFQICFRYLPFSILVLCCLILFSTDVSVLFVHYGVINMLDKD